MQRAEELVETLRRDGFVVVKGFFPVEQVEQAHGELEAWFTKDREARQAQGIDTRAWEGPAGRSQLTEPSHLLLDVYGKCPAFEALFEKILTDPFSRGLLTALAGPRFKMRGCNVRHMTGAYNPAPAHEWHRDSPGEFGIGIFLTDVPPREHAATALVPGSHLFPTDPRWNTLLPGAFPGGIERYETHNPAARRLAEVALKDAMGAYGSRGDFYLFMNDVWHGREPNLHGSRTMVALLGAFPSEFPFPDDVPLPPPDVFARLAPAIQEVVRQDQPPNPGRDSLLHWTLAHRQPLRTVKGDPFFDALRERRRAEAVSRLVIRVRNARIVLSHYLRRAPDYARLHGRNTARWIYRHTLKREAPRA